MMTKGQSYPPQKPMPVPITEWSEEQLLDAAVQFDEAALGEIYDRYEAKIFSYIYRRVGDETQTEDLTAQVFMKMLQAIRDRKGWHSSFSGWLYRIAHNIVIDYYRQRDRRKDIALDDAPDLVSERDNPMLSTELKMAAEQLRFAMRQLTEDQEEVLILRFMEGYSIGEVAVMMNKTEGAIKALQYRAVANLRGLLAHVQPHH
jgi:RNA polymerase sigma-70 factor (ECF subfamily)